MLCTGTNSSSCCTSTPEFSAETTKTSAVVQEAIKKAGKDPANASLYALVAVNIKTETTRKLNADEHPMTVLRCEIDFQLYLVHAAEAHYILKLIQLEEVKARAWPTYHT